MSLDDAQLLNTTLASLTNAIQGYYPLILLYATRLLGVIVGFQFILIAVEIARTRDLTQLTDLLAISLIRIGIVYVVLDHALDWGNAIVNLGPSIGQAVSGQSPAVLTPSGVFNLGLGTASLLMQANKASVWLHPVQEFEYFCGALAVTLLWAGAAVIYLLTLLEAAWLVGIGPILIAFSALDYTAPMLVKLATDLLAVAMKIAVLLILLAIAMTIAQEWQVLLGGNSGNIATDAYWLIISIVQAALLFALVLKLPNRIVGIVGGQVGSWAENGLGMAGSVAASAGSSMATSIGKTAAQGAEAFKQVGSTSTRSLLLR